MMSYGLGYANPHSSQIDAVYPINMLLSATMCTFAASNLIRQINMNKMIACCGINCETCEARIATIKNDDKMRVEVAKKWCEMNHTDQITPESINCVGCRVEGPKFYFCSHMCEVKKCVAAKGYETCGDCPDKNSCKKVGAIWENSAEAKENLCGK